MFEVIDSNNVRWRFDDSYTWQFGLVSGTIDVDDKSVVEVLLIDDEDSEIVRIFPNIGSVGDVNAGESIMMPERPIERCPKCGYGQLGKAKQLGRGQCRVARTSATLWEAVYLCTG